MAVRARKRLKTLLLSLGVLTITMFTVINILASEFSIEARGGEISSYSDNDDDLHLDSSYKAYEYFVLKVQRKPKTTNLEARTHKNKMPLKSSKDTVNRRNNFLHSEGHSQYSGMNMADKIIRKAAGLDYDPLQFSQIDEEIDDDDNEDDYYDDDIDEADDENDEDDYSQEKDYEFPTNAPFKPGDFGDIRGLEYQGKPKLKYEHVKPDTSDNQQNVNLKMKTSKKRQEELIENNIFWSSYVESLIPKGLPYLKVTKLLQQWRGQVVQTLDKPGWNRCGRPNNGFVVLDDGTKMCARYRDPHHSFVYGESLSFFLSRMLKMDNVPAVVLSVTNSTFKQWRVVNISSLAWRENRPVALIQWIENLNNGESSKAYIPHLLLQAYRTGQPVTNSVITGSTLLRNNPAQLAEIVQWGTMIVFDYLTGNYDRVASMQDAEDREKKPHIMEESIRNLHKSSANGKLWLIDNESGLLDAYDLLSPQDKSDRFVTFHDKMLKTICVFQSSLVKSIRKLFSYHYPHKRLLYYAQSLEPLLANVTNIETFDLFAKLFDRRLKNVIDWIDHCLQISSG